MYLTRCWAKQADAFAQIEVGRNVTHVNGREVGRLEMSAIEAIILSQDSASFTFESKQAAKVTCYCAKVLSVSKKHGLRAERKRCGTDALSPSCR